MDRQAIKAADAALGIADPVQAAAALSALADPVTVDVPAAEIRAVLWPTLEYSALVLLSEVRDFTSTPRDLVRTAMTAVSLMDSGRTVLATDAAAWTGVLGGLDAFVSAGSVSQASRTAVAALRTVQVLRYGYLSGDDLKSIRSGP